MGKVPKQIMAEKQNVEAGLDNLNKALARINKSTIELAAIGTFLHNIYNGIENILKQIASLKRIEIPKSESWHKDLLNLSVSKGIISEELSDQLYEYRRSGTFSFILMDLCLRKSIWKDWQKIFMIFGYDLCWRFHHH